MDENLSYNTPVLNLTDCSSSLYYFSEACSQNINKLNNISKLKQFSDTYKQIPKQHKINNTKTYLYTLT